MSPFLIESKFIIFKRFFLYIETIETGSIFLRRHCEKKCKNNQRNQMFLVLTFFSIAVRSQSAILVDQYTALLRFMSEGMGRTLQLNQTACPASVSPPNGRVACDFKGRITQLHLVRASLTGNLTSTISVLTDLTYLNLSDNMLVGGVRHLAALTNLETLDLSYNAISGDVLAVVESLPYLQSCVLQSPSPRDTNCFSGRLEANATRCNDARLSPLNLCKTYISRAVSTTTATTTTTTTKTTATTIGTTENVVSIATSADATNSKTVSKFSLLSTLPTFSLVETTSLATTLPVEITNKTASERSLQRVASAPASKDGQHLAVVILGVVVALFYVAIVLYVIVAKVRKHRANARMNKMASDPFKLAGDILEVVDIPSEDVDESSQSTGRVEPQKVPKKEAIYDRILPLSASGDYRNLPVDSNQVPGAVSPTLRKRNGTGFGSIPPYSQLPPPITNRQDRGQSSAKTVYDSVTSVLN